MRTRAQRHRHYRERADLYILFLVGIYNLIFVDASIAGMPLRTLLLLTADFLCIAMCLYKGGFMLPRWKISSAYERTMLVLLAGSVMLMAVFVFTGSGHFWFSVDILALLLMYPCLDGRKKFPQEIFGVYSASSYLTGVMILCYYLTDGICGPFIALLLQDYAMASWLVLSITINILAYCFQENGRVWYGGNILLDAFLLAIQKDIPAMAVTGLVPLLLPVFCRPSKELAQRAAQAAFLYGFLICNMSLVTGCTPLLEGIVSYDLEISVYMELLLAAAGVCFYSCWDRYAQGSGQDTTLPEMRVWYRKATVAYGISLVGVWAAVGVWGTDETSEWYRMTRVIISDFKENDAWKYGLFGQMGKQFGVLGIGIVCILLYIGAVQVYRTRRWRVKAHKLYRLIVAVSLLQSVFLPQNMAVLPVYTMFIFLFAGAEEVHTHKIAADNREWREKDETDNTDTLLQRGGDAGDCIE